MTTKIKVCHFISGDLWAGAEAMLCSLIKGLQEFKDLELSAILLNEGRLSDEIRNMKIPISVFNEKKLSNIQIIKNMKNIIRDKSFHIIHSHRYKENIFSYLSTRDAVNNVNLLSTQHGIPELYYSNRNIKYYLLNRINISILSLRFKAVVAVSDDINNMMKNKYCFPMNKIITIHNGIDPIVNHKQKKDNQIFVVGSMGRLFPVKNYPLMVEVANETKKYSNTIRFELAGDGPDEIKIRSLIEKNKLGKLFIMKGFIKNTTDFYTQLDLYLNTSFHEGFPIGLLEAMAHGLPIIAPRVGGIKEIMEDGIHGYMIDGHDPKVYAEKIYYLYMNRSTKIKMAQSARERVSKYFTIEHMAYKYHQLYTFVNRLK